MRSDFVASARRALRAGFDARQAEAVIASGEADLVALGHAALREPHFPLHAQQTLGAVSPDAAYASWNVQAGWWLDHRDSKLLQLGPWVPTVEAAAASRRPDPGAA